MEQVNIKGIVQMDNTISRNKYYNFLENNYAFMSLL